jgi:hypothetical protein
MVGVNSNSRKQQECDVGGRKKHLLRGKEVISENKPYYRCYEDYDLGSSDLNNLHFSNVGIFSDANSKKSE